MACCLRGGTDLVEQRMDVGQKRAHLLQRLHLLLEARVSLGRLHGLGYHSELAALVGVDDDG